MKSQTSVEKPFRDVKMEMSIKVYGVVINTFKEKEPLHGLMVMSMMVILKRENSVEKSV